MKIEQIVDAARKLPPKELVELCKKIERLVFDLGRICKECCQPIDPAHPMDRCRPCLTTRNTTKKAAQIELIRAAIEEVFRDV